MTLRLRDFVFKKKVQEAKIGILFQPFELIEPFEHFERFQPLKPQKPPKPLLKISRHVWSSPPHPHAPLLYTHLLSTRYRWRLPGWYWL